MKGLFKQRNGGGRLDDSEIIRLFFDRSEQAIALTREKYGPYCAAIAYRILSSIEDTEECVSDTWQRAWEAIPPAQPADLRAYLGRITRNLSLTRLREIRAVKRGGTSIQLALEELGECVSPGDTPEDEMLRRQLAEAVNRFLQTLPREKRAVFVLRYWYLYTGAEIARRTGIRETTVRTMLFRLRRQLKTHLEKEEVL